MRRLALLALLALPLGLAATAQAVVPGANGDIVFTSGRGGPPNNDDNAKIWRGRSAGSATQLTTGTTRHSHPAYSPDGMKVAYARSVTGAGARDIWVRDLLTGNELQLTNTPLDDDDRPAWSPDGSEIAYGSDLDVTAGTQRDIFIRPAGGGAVRNLAISSQFDEDKPAWSPDGQFIFYARNSVAVPDSDIVKELGNNTSPNPIGVVTTADNDYQPNLSPDGSKLCFSRGNMSDTGVDIYTADANGTNANVAAFASNATKGEFNCAYSPDGTRMVHALGVFTGGQVVTRDANTPNGATTLFADVAQHFDGNPDWGIDPLPTCENVTATVQVNGFVSIPLECSDPLNQNVDVSIATPPGKGNLGGIANDRVVYTPNANFTGTDTFTFKGDDGTSEDTATVTINVTPRPAGADDDETRPVISQLKASRKTFRRGSRLPRLAAKKGTTISYRLSEDARVRLTFQRVLPGRRAGGRCVKPTRRNRGGRRCKRYKTASDWGMDGKKGANSLKFQGKISKRKRLALGRYRLSARAVDDAGNRSTVKRTRFRIVRR